MSGHSKWHSIKHKKAKEDAKRGRMFSRLIKEITVAARLGGGDIDANPRLRQAVQTAKDANMPQDNITRAIKKGTGDLPGVNYEEVSYEGYGPGGAAVLIETVTDNRNRTTSELRYLFSKANGNLGETNCVAWLFTKKGLLIFEKGDHSEEELMEIALENEAEDFEVEDGTVEVTTSVENFEAVKNAYEDHGISFSAAELTMIPQNTVELEGKKAEQMLTLMEKFEDHDDVQAVYSNFDIDEQFMEQQKD